MQYYKNVKFKYNIIYLIVMIDEPSLKVILSLMEARSRFKDLMPMVKNPRTLSIKLKKLMELNLVRRSEGGYELTEKGLKVANLLRELEGCLKLQTFKIKNIERIPHLHLAPVIKKYCEILNEILGNRLISIMIFGSIARGDWDKDSDIDIHIVAEGWEGKPIWDRVGELAKAKKMVEETTEYRKALEAGFWSIFQNYPLSKEEAERFNRIYLDAIIDGIILYDKNEFLVKVLRSLMKKLEEMGSVRITLPNRKYYWILKDIRAGEVIEF